MTRRADRLSRDRLSMACSPQSAGATMGCDPFGDAKPGPNILLKIWTQALPHCVVDALAGSVAAVLRPPATVSAAAVASTLVLMDMTVPFIGTAVPCARRWCAGQWITPALV